MKGFTLDILVPSHKEAVEFGVQYTDSIEVYIPQNPKAVIKKIRETEGVRKP